MTLRDRMNRATTNLVRAANEQEAELAAIFQTEFRREIEKEDVIRSVPSLEETLEHVIGRYYGLRPASHLKGRVR